MVVGLSGARGGWDEEMKVDGEEVRVDVLLRLGFFCIAVDFH